MVLLMYSAARRGGKKLATFIMFNAHVIPRTLYTYLPRRFSYAKDKASISMPLFYKDSI